MPDAPNRYLDPPGEEKLACVDAGRGVHGVSRDLKLAIQFEARKAYPKECCGLIIKRGNKAELFPCRNISAEPDKFFRAHPDDVASAEDTGEILLGYHSHTDTGPNPSVEDKTNAESNQLASLIVAWPGGDMAMYQPCGWRAPLEGRPFVHGVLDCYALARDVFHDETGILLPDFFREDDWWLPLWRLPNDRLVRASHAKGEIIAPARDLYVDHLKESDFRIVENEPLKRLDFLLIQMPGSERANHCAVYMGDGEILHHPPGRLSVRQPYLSRRNYYHLATRLVIRHTSVA